MEVVLSMIKDFLSQFQSKPLKVDKETAHVQIKYPKNLSKFSTQSQFNDYLFRETFFVQLLVFLQFI